MATFFVLLLQLFLDFDPSPIKLFSQSSSHGFVLLVTLHKILISLEFLFYHESYHGVWDSLNLAFGLVYLIYAALQQRVRYGFDTVIENWNIVMILLASSFVLVCRSSQNVASPVLIVALLFMGVSLTIMLYQIQIKCRWRIISREKIIAAKSVTYNNIIQMLSVCENGSPEEKMLLIDWLLKSPMKIEDIQFSTNIFKQDFVLRFQSLIDNALSSTEVDAYLLELIGRFLDETISAYLSISDTHMEQFYILRIYFLITYQKFSWKTVALYFNFQKSINMSSWFSKILNYKVLWELMTAIRQTNTSSKSWYKVDIQKNIKVEQLYHRLTEVVQESLASSRAFLLEFQRLNFSISDAFNLYQQFFKHYRAIKKMAEKILELGIFCKDFYLVYLNYLRLVAHDVVEADRMRAIIVQKYSNSKSIRSKMDLILKNSEFTDAHEKFYINVDGNAKKLGLITSVSADCVRTIKLQRKEFRGTHIDSLKPKFLEGDFMARVMIELSSENPLLNNTLSSFIDIYIDADRCLIPTISCIKRYVDIDSALQYIVVSNILRDPSDQSELLLSLDWNSGVLSNWSQKPSQFFGVDSLIFDSRMLCEQDLSIEMFFPGFNDFYAEQLRIGMPTTIEMSLMKFMDLRSVITENIQTYNQIRTGGTLQNSLHSSVRNFNNMSSEEFTCKNFDEETHVTKNVIKIELQLLTIFNKFDREHGLLRIRKYEKNLSDHSKPITGPLSNGQTEKVKPQTSANSLLQVLKGKVDGVVPDNLTVFFRPGRSQLIFKRGYLAYLIGLIVFQVIFVDKIGVYFEHITTSYNESVTISKCKVIALNHIKKDDLDDLLEHSSFPELKAASDRYYTLEGLDESAIWKSIEQSYLKLLSSYYKSKGASYPQINPDYIAALEPRKSLILYPVPQIEDYYGNKLPLSFADMNTLIQITYLKLKNPIFGVSHNQDLRRFWSDVLEQMHHFWEIVLNANKAIFKEHLNDLRIWQIIEVGLIGALIVTCVLSTEIFELRMSKLFYTFAYLSKQEISEFVSQSTNFERLLDPRNPVGAEQDVFGDDVVDILQSRLVAKNSLPHSEDDDDPNSASQEEDRLIIQLSGTSKTAGNLKSKMPEKEFQPIKLRNKRAKKARSQRLRSLSTMLRRMLTIVILFALLTFWYYSYIQNIFADDSHAMEHFYTISKLGNQLEMIKYHAHSFMFIPDCTKCGIRLNKEKYDIIQNFKELNIQLENVDSPLSKNHLKGVLTISHNLCKQTFHEDRINKMLKEDCLKSTILNQGLETYTMNLADKYLHILQNPELSDAKLDILAKEFWIHETSQAIITSFGVALEAMKSVQRSTVIVIKILFVALAALLCFIILQSRSRREAVQLEQNRFALNFLLSSVVVSNQYLRDFFGKP